MTGRRFHNILLIIIVFSFIVSGCSRNQHVLSNNNNNNVLTLIFLDVGQGESILLMLPDGIHILVDAGSPAAGPGLVDAIRSLGIDRIDHLIFTHPHDDHIGGIFNVLHAFEVSNYYDNNFDNLNSTLFWDYVRLVRREPTRYHILRAGSTLDFGDVHFEVFNPLTPPTGDINEDSIVMRVSYGEVSVLLAGDVRQVGEKRILASGAELKSTILKVGHHGDSNGSTESFLEQVAPETAIISVGTNNKYEKPHEDALSRINASGAKVVRTDLHGNITVETDGATYSIATEKHFIQ
jgi:beta-lactamase superfamily II metal-dependent hydrolase